MTKKEKEVYERCKTWVNMRYARQDVYGVMNDVQVLCNIIEELNTTLEGIGKENELYDNYFGQ